MIIVSVHESTEKKELTLKKSMKVQHIMNVYKSKMIFYLKLSIIIKKEWMKQEHTDIKHASIKKKNFIINCIVIKSCVKACKDTKNMIKKSLDEKRKHVSV